LEIAAKAEAEATMAKAARKRKKKEIEGKETEDLSESHKRQKLCPVCGMEMAEERELCAECGRKEMEKERKKKKEKEKGKKKK
jgi:predicted nucleic acid-binding Zn ribbon protein